MKLKETLKRGHLFLQNVNPKNEKLFIRLKTGRIISVDNSVPSNKVRILVLFLILVFINIKIHAQVAINTDNSYADGSAMLHIKSTSKGVLISRMTTAQRIAISSPADGLMVYDTSSKSFWYYNSSSSSWKELFVVNTDGINELSDGENDGSSVFLGSDCGTSDNGANSNVGVGNDALKNVFEGTGNASLGFAAGKAITNGNHNTAIGFGTMYEIATSSNNTAVGYYAGRGSTGHNYTGCVFLGHQAGYYNTSDNKLFIDNSNTSTPLIGGDFAANTVTINGSIKITGGNPGPNKVLTSDLHGFASWTTPSSGGGATEIDDLSDAKAPVGHASYFIGGGGANESGSDNRNTSLGWNSLQNVTTGKKNVAIGHDALHENTTGQRNVAIGVSSGNNSYSGCIYIGYEAGKGNNANNKLFIDNSLTSSPLIGGDFGTNQVDINGTIRITGGNPGNGKILTSNATGTASWQTPANININGLSDGKYDGSSVFLGNTCGNTDNGSNSNAGVGKEAMSVNTSGQNNCAFGYRSLYNNSSASYNVAIGSQSLLYNRTGSNNTALGYKAGYGVSGITAVSGCVYIGKEAGSGNTTNNKLFIDNSNTASPLIGGSFSSNRVDINGTIKITGGSPGADKVLTSDANGLASWNTMEINDLSDATRTGTKFFMGKEAGLNNTGSYNTGIGYEALKANTNGDHNTAFGFKALDVNTVGIYNTAVGLNSLGANTGGDYNTVVGADALAGNVNGNYNTAVGYKAYYTGSYTNSTAIGYNTAVSASNHVYLGNSSTIEVWGAPYHETSDRRVKTKVHEGVPGLEFISKLRPVMYNFDTKKKNELLGIPTDTNITNNSRMDSIVFTGFIAQEVEKAALDCNYDFSAVHTPGNNKDLYGLSYSTFVVPLVKAVQEQQQLIDELRAQNQALLTSMNKLEAKIDNMATK